MFFIELSRNPMGGRDPPTDFQPAFGDLREGILGIIRLRIANRDPSWLTCSRVKLTTREVRVNTGKNVTGAHHAVGAKLWIGARPPGQRFPFEEVAVENDWLPTEERQKHLPIGQNRLDQSHLVFFANRVTRSCSGGRGVFMCLTRSLRDSECSGRFIHPMDNSIRWKTSGVEIFAECDAIGRNRTTAWQPTEAGTLNGPYIYCEEPERYETYTMRKVLSSEIYGQAETNMLRR